MKARIRAALADGDFRKLVGNSGFGAATTLSRLFLSAAQVVALSRVLGPSDFGRIGELAAMVGVANTFFTVRVWEWLTRFLSQALSRDDHDEAASFVKLGLAASFAVNVAAFVLLELGVELVCERLFHDPALVPYARAYALILLVAWPNDACTAALRSLDEFPLMARLGVATGTLRIVSVVLPAVLGHGLGGVVAGFVLSEAVTWLVTSAVVRARLRARTGRDLLRAPLSRIAHHRDEILGFVRAGFLVDTLRGAANHVSVFALGSFHGSREVGYYRLATQLLDVGHRLVTVVAQASLPQLAVLAHDRAMERIRALLVRATRLVGAGVVLANLAAFVAAGPVVWLLSGPAYAKAAPVVAVGALGLFWGLSFWIGPLSTALGRPRIALALVLVHTTLRVGVTFALAPAYGALGAAIADAVATGVYVLLTFFAARALFSDVPRAA